ncbi:hypothetical protein AB0N77_21490 [Streptomyces misionensis]|uniref:hypothetical protein n=1 Tax=Streptomyces misionensis TaxID=67331 RepID=UPI00341605C9
MPEEQPAEFGRWSEVPWHYASRTQMKVSDLPRWPAGPAVGYVAGRDFRDKEISVPLYDVRASRVSGASGPQLAAASGRRTVAVYECSSCGAQTQLPLSEDSGHLCVMCRRLAEIGRFQAELRERREQTGAWARSLFAGGDLAITWVELTAAPDTPSGRRRPPLAGRVQVVDEQGKKLANVLVRLAGPRTQGAPQEAVAAGDGAQALSRVLAGRRQIVWGPLTVVEQRLAELGHPLSVSVESARSTGSWAGGRFWDDSLPARFAQWRGELDPATGALRTPWEPGSADRLWWVLRRMSEHPAGDRTAGVSTAAGAVSEPSYASWRRTLVHPSVRRIDQRGSV